jgi:hypothetical protein
MSSTPAQPAQTLEDVQSFVGSLALADPARTRMDVQAFVRGLAAKTQDVVDSALQKVDSDEDTIIAQSKAAFKAALAEFDVFDKTTVVPEQVTVTATVAKAPVVKTPAKKATPKTTAAKKAAAKVVTNPGVAATTFGTTPVVPGSLQPTTVKKSASKK